MVTEYAGNPGGGTPRDGTHLLRALLDANPPAGTCCFASINNAAVVAQAQRAGVGAMIRVSLGGKQGRFQGAPIEADAYVKCITDGVSSIGLARCLKAFGSTWARCVG
ncbi:MlrC C-terminal domain-containing protein [Cupriavidus necator]|uniref:MlrC C-terminal domain-containing protein n=1 Tax=Cupriavidus necator TaxID=106590 RepID=UPI0027D828DE|nr:MlrC C-terminal domain-containing protein [Cupriavidus necator]